MVTNGYRVVMVNGRRTGDDRYMLHACLEKAPRGEQAYCLQTPGHPGTHQAYVKDSLIEWEPLMVDDPGPSTVHPSSTAA